MPRVRGSIDPQARQLLVRALPRTGPEYHLVHRQAGLGSLGRQRYAALVKWRGGTIAREAKALTTSAWTWARAKSAQRIHYARIIAGAVRVADPFLQVHAGWVVRRLAPDCSRVELAKVAGMRDERKLLWTMGWETANVHLGSRRSERSSCATWPIVRPAG